MENEAKKTFLVRLDNEKIEVYFECEIESVDMELAISSAKEAAVEDYGGELTDWKLVGLEEM